jgi:hypothetical protein
MTPTREQVRKLAREADFIDWRDEDGDQHVEQMIDSLMVIWQAARAQALEDAVSACDSERLHGDTWHPMDIGYMQAIGDCKSAIRALKGKQ